MIFTSYTYALFLLAAFVLYWSVPMRLRIPLGIVLSYAFYCSWRWQFGFLLLALSLFNWAYGRFVLARRADGLRLAVGICLNLAPLIYYKYTHFLIANLEHVAHLFGVRSLPPVPTQYLPLGISFFTFQGVAYLIDVGTGETPFASLSDFLFYKAFWPQLIAGPIVRPGEIRTQIEVPRTLHYSDIAVGLGRVAQGAFKKVVLADTLGPFVDAVFLPGAHPGFVDTTAATAAFALQIYFDFSGYSDIAIGSARLLGFELPENFEWPYLARSPQEFWNRWHMTLSRWIRDYLFTPLAFTWRGSRLSLLAPIAAMAICGFWHGAQWTFIAWGAWHGVLLLLNQTVLRSFFARAMSGSRLKPSAILAAVVTLGSVLSGWILFRAQSLGHAIDLFRAIATVRGGLRPTILRENALIIIALFWCGLFAYRAVDAIDLFARPETPTTREARAFATALRYVLITMAVIIFQHDAQAFVYFQF